MRLLSSGIANRVRRIICHDPFQDLACGVRAFYKTCLEGIAPFNGIHRWLPVLFLMKGCEVREIPVQHYPRTTGTAHYGIGNRLFRGISDMFGIRWLQRRMINYELDDEDK